MEKEIATTEARIEKLEPELQELSDKRGRALEEYNRLVEAFRLRAEAKNDLISSRDDLQRKATAKRNAASQCLIAASDSADSIVDLKIPALIRKLKQDPTGRVGYGGLQFTTDSGPIITELQRIEIVAPDKVRRAMRRLKESSYRGVVVSKI